MFTGIIESIGKVERVEKEGSGKRFLISSAFSNELRPDESVSHDGICLTVTGVEGGCHWVTAVQETIDKSTFGNLKTGSLVNLERSMLNNGRFDGHIVQGHVDQTGVVKAIRDDNGSWLVSFEYDASLGNITVEKGSVSVNGVSLTCFDVKRGGFSVVIIPHTYRKTNFSFLKEGDRVNLEFDILGKYISRLVQK